MNSRIPAQNVNATPEVAESPLAPVAPVSDIVPEPVLSVLMPVYNERATIHEIVSQVLSSPWVGQLVIVDDCSNDGTTQLLRDEIEGSEPRIRVLYHEVNQGKGAAIRTGREILECPLCIIQDADLEYDPAEYGRMVGPLRRGVADVVYGSRFRGDVRRVLFFWHALGNRFLTLVSNVCTNLNLTDMETCYKAFRTEVFQSLPFRSNRFGIEPEVTAMVARRSLRVYEVPISYHGRTYTEGKKIGWKDGVNALWVILREWLFGARRDLTHGHRTLSTIAPLHRYHRFLWNTVSEYAGQRVVEVGAGIGNITGFLRDRDQLWVTDLEDTYLRHLEASYEKQPKVEVFQLDLQKPLSEANAGSLRGQADTAVAFNVIEHLEDDLLGLRVIGDLLEPGGRLLLIVPAGPALYGAIDRDLDHFRRYKRAELEDLLRRAGFEPESTTWANSVGAFGWWLNGRILRRRYVPRFQAKLNDLLVPWLRLERRLGLPFGLSLVVVARHIASDKGHG